MRISHGFIKYYMNSTTSETTGFDNGSHTYPMMDPLDIGSRVSRGETSEFLGVLHMLAHAFTSTFIFPSWIFGNIYLLREELI